MEAHRHRYFPGYYCTVYWHVLLYFIQACVRDGCVPFLININIIMAPIGATLLTTMMLRSILLLNVLVASVAFSSVRLVRHQHSQLFSSDWGDFAALEDDDDEILIDRTDYAKEEDTQEDKAAVGSEMRPPTIENDAEPIFVPQGE